MRGLASLLPLLLASCWPFLLEPDPREDLPLEADADVDADADADADVDADADADADCPTPDADLGSALGSNLSGGNSCPGIDDYAKSCGGVPGPDVAFAWTAPRDSAYQVDLQGSDYDTVLTVQTACPEADELECNDDFQSNVTSGVVRNFAAGEPMVFVVEGYAVGCGNFQINVTDVGTPPELAGGGSGDTAAP